MSEIYNELVSELQPNESELSSSSYPKPIIELRVVVQRVLINIPHTSKETVAELSSCVAGSEDEDDLITCHSCGICVHRCKKLYNYCSIYTVLDYNYAACYGVTRYSSLMEWLCQRCQAGVSHNQDCSLCLLRGGALKPTDGGRWAHLVCAVTIPDVYLGDVQTKEPVITENITRARRKLVCIIQNKLRILRIVYLSCSGAHCVFPCRNMWQCEAMVCVFSAYNQSVVLQCTSRVHNIMDCLMKHFSLEFQASVALNIWYTCLFTNCIFACKIPFQHRQRSTDIKRGDDVYVLKDKRYSGESQYSGSMIFMHSHFLLVYR